MLRSWKLYRAGQEVELPGGVANVLIGRHLARSMETVAAVAIEPEPPADSKEKNRRVSRR